MLLVILEIKAEHKLYIITTKSVKSPFHLLLLSGFSWCPWEMLQLFRVYQVLSTLSFVVYLFICLLLSGTSWSWSLFFFSFNWINLKGLCFLFPFHQLDLLICEICLLAEWGVVNCEAAADIPIIFLRLVV